jgi:hypothetical protein
MRSSFTEVKKRELFWMVKKYWGGKKYLEKT